MEKLSKEILEMLASGGADGTTVYEEELARELLELRAAVEWKPITRESLPKVGDSVLFNVPSCYGVEKGIYCDDVYHSKVFLCDRGSPCGDEICFSIEEVDMWLPLPMPDEGGKKER